MKTLILLFPLMLGCVHQDTSTSKSSVEAAFFRAGFREDNLTLAFPLVLQQRKTDGYRSQLELRTDIKVTRSITNPSIVPPNGVVLTFRYRW